MLETAIVLHWTAVAGASAYQLEIASDETFAEPIVQQRVAATQYRWDDVPETRVYWRVRSQDGEGRVGEWSESKEIQAVFVAPLPLRPKAQAVFALNERVRCEWSASKIFTSYRVEIADESSFAHPLVDKIVSEAHFTFIPAGIGNFSWRVRGIDFADRATGPSAPQSFKVRIALVVPLPVGHTPDATLPATQPAVRTASSRPARAFVGPQQETRWSREWQVGPTLALGYNLHALVLYSLGLEAGFLRGTEREQVGFTLHFGFYPANQLAGRIASQAFVFPADFAFTYARVLRSVRFRLGLGLALNTSVVAVDVPGSPRLSQVALSPGVATFVGVEVPLGPGAFSAELRLTTAPRQTTAIHFETGGLVAAFGYLFYL